MKTRSGMMQRVARRHAPAGLAALARALGWSGGQLRTPAVRQNEGPGDAVLATRGCALVSEVVTVFGVVARGGEASFTCAEMTEHATTDIGVIEKFLPVSFHVGSTGLSHRPRVIAGRT